ncbi:MAG: hypothetical protein AB1705_11390 [Verrucomicrobiota bacterium]
MRLTCGLFSLAILAASTCASQAQTPEEVVAGYFEKIKAGGGNTVAALMHPDELKKFHAMMTPVVEGALASPQAKAFQKFADPSDPAKKRTMTDAEFMNLFMEWVELVQPGAMAALKGATIEALGHVSEGEVKHVVVRVKVKSEGLEVEKMSVLSVKNFQGVPKLTLTGEMKGIAEALRRRK